MFLQALAAIEFFSRVPVAGFLVMVILPLGFVLALSLGILRESRAWTVVSTVTGVLLLAALVVFLVRIGEVTNVPGWASD